MFLASGKIVRQSFGSIGFLNPFPPVNKLIFGLSV
jgi:hypothetical protein